MTSTAPMPLFDLQGTWTQMGRQLGRQVREDVVSFNKRYFSDAFNVMRFGSQTQLEKYVQKIAQVLREYAPDAFDFAAGLADGANLPLEQVLMQTLLPELTHINSQRDWPKGLTGCTSSAIGAARSAAHGALIAQCWDFNVDLPPWYAARLSPPLDSPKMLIVGAGSFFCCCGINSLDLAVTFTSSGHLPNVPCGTGVPVAAVLFEALGCQEYYEAMDLVVAPPKAGAFNLLLTDRFRSVLVEAAANRVELTEEESILVCGNHFQHPNMIQSTGQDLNPAEPPSREFAQSSCQRAERLRTLLDQTPDKRIGIGELKEYLKDHEHFPLSLCAHEEGTILHFKTLGAMILEPGMQTIHFCPDPPCKGKYQTFIL